MEQILRLPGGASMSAPSDPSEEVLEQEVAHWRDFGNFQSDFVNTSSDSPQPVQKMACIGQKNWRVGLKTNWLASVSTSPMKRKVSAGERDLNLHCLEPLWPVGSEGKLGGDPCPERWRMKPAPGICRFCGTTEAEVDGDRLSWLTAERNACSKYERRQVRRAGKDQDVSLLYARRCGARRARWGRQDLAENSISGGARKRHSTPVHGVEVTIENAILTTVQKTDAICAALRSRAYKTKLGNLPAKSVLALLADNVNVYLVRWPRRLQR